MTAIVARAAAAFEHRFGSVRQFAAAAPGRINLIGEHTDYNGGFVLPCAIDRWAIIVGSPASAHSTLVAADLNRNFECDLAAATRSESEPWANHLLGVAAQFSERGVRLPPLSLLLMSAVPIGAGLGSSAAIKVAMATLLKHLGTTAIAPVELAQLCQRAEHEFVGTPCGLMDMRTSIAAQPRHALLIDCESNDSHPIPLPEDMALLVVNTGVRHDLAISEYAERRSTCESAARKLGLPTLRYANLEMLRDESLTDAERCRASHVVTENTRTLLAASALVQNDLATLGRLMFDSHRSLRELYEVSCPELDVIVDAAAELHDAGAVFGARMTGGGFGGCAIVLCRPHETSNVGEFIAARFAERFDRRPEVFEARVVGGARGVHFSTDPR